MKVHRHVVICIHASGDDNVERGFGGDSLYSWDIPAESDDCEIDYRINASRFQLIQPSYCIGDSFIFVSPRLREVLHDLSRKHEDVFVHQRSTQFVRISRRSNCVHQSHDVLPALPALIDSCALYSHLLYLELDQDTLGCTADGRVIELELESFVSRANQRMAVVLARKYELKLT